ncbi:MAG TPA: 16S rRNA (guanine(966)-N(2))-methyltransferase RsmD [Bryobacteraceae bacterium]|jgi:16S rRNA (guanine(966)-N(2))-methyltransferase RsmD|nr:16S rRNA (guanine(966)-N(2))-methyltransferase RsmD [Bryobacteraceae bacterium]
MRVISGEFRSRKLESMPGMDVRPTPDKVRQALFNIIAPEIQDAVFVDAYAGTGAVGIEALSRGARHVVFIESERAAADLIRRNLASLQAEARARVIRGRASLYVGSLDADLVFLDPPYPKEREYLAALEALESKPPRMTIVQHAARFELKDRYGPLRKTRTVRYGDNALSFFRT